MMANPILPQKKYSRVLEQFSQQVSLTREQALRFIYRSDLHKLMKDGVSDMQFHLPVVRTGGFITSMPPLTVLHPH